MNMLILKILLLKQKNKLKKSVASRVMSIKNVGSNKVVTHNKQKEQPTKVVDQKKRPIEEGERICCKI